MTGPLPGDPYPEPVEPPLGPREDEPASAPQEAPAPAPIDDTGRPTATAR